MKTGVQICLALVLSTGSLFAQEMTGLLKDQIERQTLQTELDLLLNQQQKVNGVLLEKELESVLSGNISDANNSQSEPRVKALAAYQGTLHKRTASTIEQIEAMDKRAEAARITLLEKRQKAAATETIDARLSLFKQRLSELLSEFGANDERIVAFKLEIEKLEKMRSEMSR